MAEKSLASLRRITVNERIDSFTRWFQTEIRLISEINFGQREEVYKRLLFCCLIDTITDATDLREAPGKESDPEQVNKPKFLKAIERYGKWPSYNKVSYVFLKLLLSKTEDPKFGGVKKHMAGVPDWPDESIVSISRDLDEEWFEKNWPRDSCQKPVKIAKKTFRDLRHDMLFYHFRNKLVHEVRAVNPEYETNLDEKYPFYHRGQDCTAEPNRRFYHLVHTPQFVKTLALNILDGLATDCRRNQIDPWKHLAKEPYWSEWR
jgi:hypothetical protein